MEKNVSGIISEAFENKELLSKVNKCTSIEEMYSICKDSLPNVTEEEFVATISSMDVESLEDEDLECVAGGLKIGSIYIE